MRGEKEYMTDERKVLLLPLVHGFVTFATDVIVTVESGDGEKVDYKRENIVGRQPEKHEAVLVVDVQELRVALKEEEPLDALQVYEDDEVCEFAINGKVTNTSQKAVFIRLEDGRDLMLPKQFVQAEIDEYVTTARLPRWLAIDRGL